MFNNLTLRRGPPLLLLTGEGTVLLFLNVSGGVLVTNIKKLLIDEDMSYSVTTSL